MKLNDMSKRSREPLVHVNPRDLMPLPATDGDAGKDRPWAPLSANTHANYECALDDTCAVSVAQPKSKEEEDALIRKFLSGLEKLFDRENNWTFLQPLLLTMEHCAKCQTCS
ncbi:MAG TPA: (Fe-S)-binding protein, partial [Terriglobia bacterium]|nr:(Fe-S)-binding protein [Terriglobia bacterium]